VLEGVSLGGQTLRVEPLFLLVVPLEERYADGTMKQLLLLVAACIAASFGLGCAPVTATASTSAAKSPQATTTNPPVGYTKEIVLWPKGAPGALGTGDGDVPKMFAYPAAGAGVHTAVIVLPGGGYTHLVTEKEGGAEARWMNEHGVTAFVLEYRLGPRYHFPSPMLDGARAIRYVRSHAAELGVARDRIGLWGFSAGGHLAGYLAAVHDAGEPSAADVIDRVSDRPDFVVMSYGRFSLDESIPRATNMEGLLGDHPTQAMLDSVSVVKLVTKDTSPCFIYSTTADQTVNSMNATALYDALKRAGVAVELHIFERGPHGTGMAQGLKDLRELAIYPTLLANWMEIHGWMASEQVSLVKRTGPNTGKGNSESVNPN
jgi:acetyl esterase/lipase